MTVDCTQNFQKASRGKDVIATAAGVATGLATTAATGFVLYAAFGPIAILATPVCLKAGLDAGMSAGEAIRLRLG